ncbi:nucleotidyltransferase family protein [Gracilibacillus sp. S3-1-1]|uniref:Nucleotidyltransferase family protein n=1 Tax=Gracilibacillus pellucidus TaxID=3095368 RepID=A0ACC6M7W9_9BACI|nr:nucleotidyltransferase family protein [Gracilibacillus sp. S3-1-1]MDX8047070.1 nucleotidyltransferase family protein [Gracilibacillus sp. S3-1-1]
MVNEKEIIEIIKEDEWMMDILKAAKSLNLPDWWVCAGFVRSKVWDTLHHFSDRTPIPDIDVIYFDPANIDELEEKKLEETLKNLLPNTPWSVKNEARMHIKSNMSPYTSAVDAISKFPETATALGVKLDEKDNVILTAPCGISDVLQLKVKPNHFFTEDKERINIYEERIAKKDWKSIWPKLTIQYVKDTY